jgi:cathepsin L
MKFELLALCIVLFSLSSTLALKDLFKLHLWDQFKKTHSKTYYSDEHENYRFSVFQSHLDLIEKHNEEYSMGLHTYTLGVNSFADWTFQEFKDIMLGTRKNMTTHKAGASATFIRLPKNVQVPNETDWRTMGAVTPVKNQGRCGSCWAFSTTGSLEAAHFRATNKLVSLSEQQLVDCSGKDGNQGCNGGLMDNAFKYIEENGGIDTEESYPYHAHNQKCHFKKDKIGSLCSGYVDLESGDEEALKEAVATIGPVSIAIDATEGNFMLYKEGVFVDDTCTNGPDSLDHGVLVVGYGTDVTSKSGQAADYWIVKNSWGPEWGEQGYIRMARNLNNMCGIATSASYPLVKKE